MPFASLPADILRDIFSRCKPDNIAATCHDFATIVYSIHTLWSHVQLRPSQLTSTDAPEFLRRRVERAGILPLNISIGPISNGEAARSPSVITEICKTLSDFNLRIRQLEITTGTAIVAGTILSDIFPNSHSVYPTLRSLSFRLPEEDLSVLEGPWPRLDVVLKQAIELFPMLRFFSTPTFNDCVPMFPENASFMHLHTLVLDGSLEQGEATIPLLVGVLSSTPNLETLWLKHTSREQAFRLDRQILNIANGRAIPIPVQLPHLTTLSLAAPGCGSDILYCIEAPALETLHLDGSRGPFYGETEPDSTPWSDWSARSVHGALQHLASRTNNLRRLALTSIFLAHAGWQWLLIGNRQGTPFPHLESLSLHGLEESSGRVLCGLDDDLLLRYSSNPTIALRRLVILRCRIPLSGSAVVQAFGGTETGRKSLDELEFDTACPQFTEDELDILKSRGIKAVRRSAEELKEVEWWTQGHGVDITDSYAY